MDSWQKETLNLEVGDTIIWQDEAVEVESRPALVAPGMKGKVLSLHDGFHLDVAEVAPIPPRAMVQFENGMRLMVDERMKWERVDLASHFFSNCTLSGNSSLASTLIFLSQFL
jgi:hypothetical protein